MSDYSSLPKGLENLKSIFANNVHKTPQHTDVTQINSNYDNTTSFNQTDLRVMNSVFDKINKPYEKISISRNNSIYDNLSSFTNTFLNTYWKLPIVQEEIGQRASDFIFNQPKHINDSRLVPDGYSKDDGIQTESPILDTLLRQPPSFVSDDLLTKLYNQQDFDPRVPKNDGVQITKNGYMGTMYIATNPTDYSKAGDGQGFQGAPPIIPPLSQLGLDLGASQGWEALYNKDHTSKDVDGTLNTPFKPYLYGGVINRDNLDIRKEIGSDVGGKNYFEPSRRSNPIPGYQGSQEPYIVSEMPIKDNDNGGGRQLNRGNRAIPIVRANTDLIRVAKFMSSPAGVAWTVKQQINQFIPTAVVKTVGTEEEGEILVRVPQRYNEAYNPLSTLSAVSPLARPFGMGMPIALQKRNESIFGDILDKDEYGKSDTIDNYSINDTFTSGAPASEELPAGDLLSQLSDFGKNLFKGQRPVAKTSAGDFMTLMEFGGQDSQNENHVEGTRPQYKDTLATAHPSDSTKIEAPKSGMPFYFKDLRDNAWVFFRAYLEGINENIVPSWAETNYIGRSEPVFSYERTVRDLTFTLKLFAHTKQELQMIYKKLNKLTSMCYPEYAYDEFLSDTQLGIQKVKMKPPLVKFRMGELYGKSGNELLGFVRSLNTIVPEEAVWETEQKMRVPKFLMVTITFGVIHSETPHLLTDFYGYTGN